MKDVELALDNKESVPILAESMTKGHFIASVVIVLLLIVCFIPQYAFLKIPPVDIIERHEFPIDSKAGGTVDVLVDELKENSHITVSLIAQRKNGDRDLNVMAHCTRKETLTLKDQATSTNNEGDLTFHFASGSKESEPLEFANQVVKSFDTFRVQAKLIGTFDDLETMIIVAKTPNYVVLSFIWSSRIFAAVLSIYSFSISLLSGKSILYLAILGILSCNPLTFIMSIDSMFLNQAFDACFHWAFRYVVITKMASLLWRRKVNSGENILFISLFSVCGIFDVFSGQSFENTLFAIAGTFTTSETLGSITNLIYVCVLFYFVSKLFTAKTNLKRTFTVLALCGCVDALCLVCEACASLFQLAKSSSLKSLEICTVGVLSSYLLFSYIESGSPRYQSVVDDGPGDVDLEGDKFEVDHDDIE